MSAPRLDLVAIRARFTQERNRRGWSPDKVSKALSVAGFDTTGTTVTNYETGKVQKIDIEFAVAFSRAFGIDLYDLLGLKRSNVVPFPQPCPRCAELEAKLKAVTDALGGSPESKVARPNRSRKGGAAR